MNLSWHSEFIHVHVDINVEQCGGGCNGLRSSFATDIFEDNSGALESSLWTSQILSPLH